MEGTCICTYDDMEKIILAVNAGSSSLKISLFKSSTGSSSPTLLATASISKLTSPEPTQKIEIPGTNPTTPPPPAKHITTQPEALDHLLPLLPVNPSEISLITHRIVHGAGQPSPELLTKETIHRVAELSALAPLHNAPALSVVEHCQKKFQDTPNLACFDTAFHETIERHVYTYAISPDVAEKNHLRRYGFHGLSYKYLTRLLPKGSYILCHLGSGSSICAVHDGKSIDTTMGLTPVSGLPGATRSGDVDPSLVFHYASNVGKLAPSSTHDLHISRAERILNLESGWKALTGTADFEEITRGMNAGSNRVGVAKKLAFDMFVDRIVKTVAGYIVTLGSLDGVVFAGGIGEASWQVRMAVCDKLGWFGVQVDERENRNVKVHMGDVKSIGKKVLVAGTDEQKEMAIMCSEGNFI